MIGSYGLLEPGNMANAQPRFISAISGALTLVAANADVYALQNDSSSKVLSLSRLEASFTTSTVFSAAQALLFGFYKVAGFTSIHSGGTGIKTISVQGKDSRLEDSTRQISDVNCRMAAAAAITTATYTAPDADEPFAVLACQLSTGAAGSMLWEPSHDRFPLQLREHEGIVCRPLITMGTGGVGSLFVRAEFTNS